MKITICGSMKFDPEMTEIATKLRALGYDTEKPNVVEGHAYGDNLDANAKLKRDFIDEHFAKIDQSDAVLIVNMEKNGVSNYIGGNTLIEVAHAYASGLEVFLLNPVPEVSYADEIRGMQPIVLDGEVARLHEYFQSLPLLMMSTESALKQRAVSRALRRAGIRVRIDGRKVPSGVSEQPESIEESYRGAQNRHATLKQSAEADYYATIESGEHVVHADHNVFGCSVVILERAGEAAKIGIDLDLEFPRAMTDKVPSQYPDLGVLVQQEYGADAKDPFPYFTGGKLTRAKILENATYNVAVQLTPVMQEGE